MKFRHLLHRAQRLVLFNCEVTETTITADLAFVGRNLGASTVVTTLKQDQSFTVELPPALQSPHAGLVEKVQLTRVQVP